jgi:hypothetical protein
MMNTNLERFFDGDLSPDERADLFEAASRDVPLASAIQRGVALRRLSAAASAIQVPPDVTATVLTSMTAASTATAPVSTLTMLLQGASVIMASCVAMATVAISVFSPVPDPVMQASSPARIERIDQKPASSMPVESPSLQEHRVDVPTTVEKPRQRPKKARISQPAPEPVPASTEANPLAPKGLPKR